MSIPWYVSDEIKKMLKTVDTNNPDTVFDLFDDTGLMTFTDAKTGAPRVCGVLVLKYHLYELPVVLLEGYVYDFVNRIYNRDFRSYYNYTGAVGINADRSRYLLTQPMLSFFVNNNIKFMREGRTLRELNNNKLTRWDSYTLDQCWMMV